MEAIYLSRIDRVVDMSEILMTIVIKENFNANQSEGDKLSVPCTIDKVVLLSLLDIFKDKLRQNSINEDKTAKIRIQATSPAKAVPKSRQQQQIQKQHYGLQRHCNFPLSPGEPSTGC